MKLYKALKEKKNLIGEITKLKQQIKDKNSYIEGSKNGENFDVKGAYEKLLVKINSLTNLKFVINEANTEIQAKIYILAEYKALISFWNEVSVVEGKQVVGYQDNTQVFNVQVTETKRNELVEDFQKKVDAIQDELDMYNYNTDVQWGDEMNENLPEEPVIVELPLSEDSTGK